MVHTVFLKEGGQVPCSDSVMWQNEMQHGKGRNLGQIQTVLSAIQHPIIKRSCHIQAIIVHEYVHCNWVTIPSSDLPKNNVLFDRIQLLFIN